MVFRRTVGLIRKLATVMPPKPLRTLAMGMWQSRLLFGLALVGSQWLPEPYLARQGNKMATTKGEMLLLQRLQNKLMRILMGTNDARMPTTQLLNANKMLSVTQLTVAATAAAGRNAAMTSDPQWLAQQLVRCQDTRTAFSFSVKINKHPTSGGQMETPFPLGSLKGNTVSPGRRIS